MSGNCRSVYQCSDDGIRTESAGIEVEVREWSHDSVEKLQEDNLRVEQEGAEAVALPEALLQGTDDIDILITQFAPSILRCSINYQS